MAPREMEESGRRADGLLDSIFENLPNGVFLKDARDLAYLRVNPAFAQLVDLSPAQLLGRTDAEVFPASLAAAQRERDREAIRLKAPLDTPDEIVATRSRGPRVVHTRRVPIFDAAGDPLYLLGISEDVTERKTVLEEVRLARLEAERASRAKSDFLSRMSHDLRTPLNAILGFAQVLAMDALTPEQSDSVHQILEGGSHLLQLINEVLDIARIEAGHLSLETEAVPLGEVVPQVVDLARQLGAAARIDVVADLGEDAGVYVQADRQRLRQVLLNLVANGVKYNRGLGTVRVFSVASPGLVRLLVSDTGRGIPADKMGRLFRPFDRLGAEEGAIEGTGLGLALSKGLTEAMGGRIGVESRPGAGSTFWIELPRADPPAAPAAAAAAPEAAAPEPGRPPAGGTLLYVEDNRSNVRLLERVIERRGGVRLLVATTGEAALAMADASQPDLVLLDLHLPDMMGEEVLRGLGAGPRTGRIPVAVLSADATGSQQDRLLAAGAVAYLTKPLDLPRLLQLLDERLPRPGPRRDGAWPAPDESQPARGDEFPGPRTIGVADE